jgi:hypothetical protein
MLFRRNSDFGGLIFQWLVSAPRLCFAAERTELFLILVYDDQAVVVPGMMAYCLRGDVRILSPAVHVHLRAGVHVPTKSVSVPAAISVELIFRVSLWSGSTRGRHDKVIGTSTDMWA